MALASGALPDAAVGTVARTDFNNAMDQLDAAFPLAAVNIAALAVETAKIDNLAVTAAKLAADACETDKIKNLNVTKGKAELGFGRYVARAVAAADFTIANFGVRDAWQADALDLSGIVPVGTVAVEVLIGIKGNAAGLPFGLRGNATTKAFNKAEIETQVANIAVPHIPAVIFIDADRLVDYYNKTGIDTANVTVLSWFL